MSLNSGAGAFILEQKTKKRNFFSSKTSSVSVYVCAKCGRIEFIAEKPELFENDILEK